MTEKKTDAGWRLDTGRGYFLGLDGRKIFAENAQGKRLKSIPSSQKNTEAYETLQSLLVFLQDHEKGALEEVEGWMLMAMPVLRQLMEAYWQDDVYRARLDGLLVAEGTIEGGYDAQTLGLLRGADSALGLEVLGLDGETRWQKSEVVFVPHPALVQNRDGFRQLAAELKLTSGADQLFRATYLKPQDEGALACSGILDYSGATFSTLGAAFGIARGMGYLISDNAAVTRVFAPMYGAPIEARYQLGGPREWVQPFTRDLRWVLLDKVGGDRLLTLEEVTPVAYSEGMRMAAAIYAKQKRD